MYPADLIYLVFITVAMGALYVALLALFPIFFTQKKPFLHGWSLFSFVLVILGSILAYAISFSIRDLEFGNRILHALGGGFLGMFVCFLAVRDSGVHITKFQFFVFSSLLVLALGIGNELLEFILQEYSGFVFAASTNSNDTLFDLASNVVGVIIAGTCFIPFQR